MSLPPPPQIPGIPERLSALSPDRREVLERLLKDQSSTARGSAIPRRTDRRSAVLSFAQQRLWFLDQLTPGLPLYNQHIALRLEFPLDVDAFERSLREIVRRHEILRTTFETVRGDPVPLIAESPRTTLDVVDLSHLSDSATESEVLRLASEDARRPFDLRTGPLIRTTLLRLRPDCHVFLLTMHHILCDGWSTTVFFRELGALYAAFSTGKRSPLPELPIQYADFAAWQRAQLSGDTLARQLSYWRDRLADLPTLLLPTDRPRPATPTFEGAYKPLVIPAAVVEGIEAISRSEGATLFMGLLAAFDVLLHRYTGQDDIVVGSPSAGRTRPELEDLIGFFVNGLVLRVDVSGNPTFRQLLGRVREMALGAYAHQDLPFEMLVEELHPERDLSRNPLFQVMFQFFTPPKRPPAGAAVVDSLWTQVERGTANVDIALDLVKGPDGEILGRVEYSTELFDAETIGRLMEHYERLLEGIVRNPSQRVSELPLLGPRERQQVLVEWNATARAYPRERCVHELIAAQAARTPDAVAVVAGGEMLRYGALEGRANQLAHALRQASVGPDVLVGLAVDRSAAMVVGLLGVLKAGGAYLPLDPAYPPARLAYMLADARAPVLLTQAALRAQWADAGARVLCLDADWPAIAAHPASAPAPLAQPEHLAYVIYTSGSTGPPKGVMIPHRALCNHLAWMQQEFPLTDQDRVLQKYSLGFDVSAWEILGPLLAGACVVCVGPGEHRDLHALVRAIVDERITAIDVVPSMLQLLLDDPRLAASQLRRITCGGEAMPPSLPPHVFGTLKTELHNIYGPTEATIGCTWWTCRPDAPQDRVPIGRPIANTQVYVLDRYLNPCPIGVPGELHVAGDALAHGYLNAPEHTAERFIANPFSGRSGDRLYKTGDRVRYRADGNLEYLGRLDDQVKIRGFRIEPGEPEAVLRSHPAVRDAAVVPQPIDRALKDVLANPGSDSAAQWLAARLLEEMPADADRLLATAERLSDAEATLLLRYEGECDRRNGMMRREQDFEVLLHITNDDFVRPPRPSQRNWLLQRALDEFTDDLKHLHALSGRFVPGSDRPAIVGRWQASRAEYDGSQLTIEGQQVMQAWEQPLMKAMADLVGGPSRDVLEIGFGMGIAATLLQDTSVRSHSIVECNDDVIRALEQWSRQYPDRNIRIVRGRWQDVWQSLGEYDGVLFDTYPTSEEEFRDAVLENITFAESFIPVGHRLLRPGGILTYYTNEIDSFSRRHQRLVLDHFSSVALSVVKSLSPPPDCAYYWANSMVVVKAVK
jgi:amino acid adenylation domain-containing protein